MAKQVIEDNVWRDRFTSANKYYKQWEGRFRCNELEKYYEGLQWMSQKVMGYYPYVINKYYELIQLKVSKYVPSFPNFILSPKPASAQWDFDTAAQTTQIKEDLLNTLIEDDRKHFTEEVEQAYKDSFFRFGLMEVGYSADWIENPNAEKPLLKKDTDKHAVGEKGRKVLDQPPELPLNERIFFKRVPAKTFRVGGLDHRYLDRCGWVGYYEFIEKDDLLSLKIMNRHKVENASGTEPEPETESVDTENANFKHNALKIWRIWDNRAKVQLIVLDSPCVTLFQRTFKRIPLVDLRPDRRVITNGFYPIPPSYHWLSPQNEINETREQLRAHRRRFTRKFQCRRGTVDDAEIEKFETGPDGSLVQTDIDQAIQPINDANLGGAIQESIPLSQDDLNRISGSTSEEQGVADRTTATQAKIVDTRSSVRGSKDQDRIVTWFSRMGREALLIAQEKFVLGTWIQSNAQEGPTFGQDFQQQEKIFKWISSDDLNDGFDFKVDVDLTSISQSIQDLEKSKMLEFLSTLTQFPMVAFSPVLVTEIAYRIGYRNQRVIKEFQQMALLMELQRLQQLQAAAGGGQPQAPQNGNNGQQIVAGATPPAAQQIQQNMNNQLPNVVQ